MLIDPRVYEPMEVYGEHMLALECLQYLDF